MNSYRCVNVFAALLHPFSLNRLPFPFLHHYSVVADTCVAMEEWVQNPHAHTALDDILPCVDFATANESLYQSKEVTFQLVNMVNQVIANVSNTNFPPNVQPFYYNQSGPQMPLLCNPFTSNLTARQCVTGEVDFNSSTQVKIAGGFI